MPLYRTIAESDGITLHVWKITETEEELSKGIQLTPVCAERLNGMRSELHRRGFLSIRHLLSEEGYVDSDLYYDEAGKPHLKDGKHISITHSFNFTAIIIGTVKEVGIDIEKQREKILKIAHKFTPIAEYKTLANTEALIRKLTMVWGAKESLYKIYATKGLSFLHHIDISDFSLTDSGTTGIITFKGVNSSYQISFLEFEGFTCVYAIKDQ